MDNKFAKGILLIDDIELNIEYKINDEISKTIFCIVLETKAGFTYGETIYDLEKNLKK